MEKNNVHKKLATARVNLQKLDIKKSGKNAFAKFKYFELTDVLPHINEIFVQLGLLSVYNFLPEVATLKIIDSETGEAVEFSIATAIEDISAKMGEDKQSRGMQPVQRLGSIITYTKRYLYFNALEISESDAIDALEPNNPNKKNTENQQGTNEQAYRRFRLNYEDKIKLESLRISMGQFLRKNDLIRENKFNGDKVLKMKSTEIEELNRMMMEEVK